MARNGVEKLQNGHWECHLSGHWTIQQMMAFIEANIDRVLQAFAISENPSAVLVLTIKPEAFSATDLEATRHIIRSQDSGWLYHSSDIRCSPSWGGGIVHTHPGYRASVLLCVEGGSRPTYVISRENLRACIRHVLQTNHQEHFLEVTDDPQAMIQIFHDAATTFTGSQPGTSHHSMLAMQPQKYSSVKLPMHLGSMHILQGTTLHFSEPTAMNIQEPGGLLVKHFL